MEMSQQTDFVQRECVVFSLLYGRTDWLQVSAKSFKRHLKDIKPIQPIPTDQITENFLFYVGQCSIGKKAAKYSRVASDNLLELVVSSLMMGSFRPRALS